MLQPVVVRAPGFGGLNLEGEEINANPRFARVAKNIVFDNAGRLASRKGYVQINDTVAGDVQSIFVYDGTAGISVITAMGADIYEDATDETGSLTPSGNHWQFQNFNSTANGSMVIGCQQGESMIGYNGTGTFATIVASAGTIPNGNALHSAFGRLWACDGNATLLKWSAILDETDWGAGGAQEFNILSNEAAVRNGYDEIVAINHLQDKLVVFLRNSIIILDNPEDPANMTIFKTIDNIGCVARDSVQAVGNDLLFLSRDGLRSLARAVEDDNMPLRDLSSHVRTDLVAAISGSPEAVKSAYYPDEGIYILLFTDSTAWVFDFKRIFEDPLPRVTTWHVPKWHSLYYHEGTLYIGQEGEYGQYSGYQDDGASYQFHFESTNVDFDRPEIKNLKKTQAAFKGADNQQITFTYDWDYGRELKTETSSIPSLSTGGIYGTGAYGTATYGTGVTRAEVRVNPFGGGEVVSFGLMANVDGSQLVLEQISHFATLGRLRR